MTTTPTHTVLDIGCGRRASAGWFYVPDRILTLDADERVNPTVVCRLGVDRIPLDDNSVGEINASHVIEHIGRQGETADWFFFWEDLYRVLEPGGLLHFTSPLASSTWAWADPSHTRALTPESFTFFNQDSYRLKDSNISPFRIRCDFTWAEPIKYLRDVNPDVALKEPVSHFSGVLQARKPFRGWWES